MYIIKLKELNKYLQDIGLVLIHLVNTVVLINAIFYQLR